MNGSSEQERSSAQRSRPLDRWMPTMLPPSLLSYLSPTTNALLSSVEAASAVSTCLFSYTLARRVEAMETIRERNWQPLLWGTQVTLGLSVTGMIAGAMMSGRKRGVQFLCENAHRLPRTKGGWYMYHKHKQHEVVHAAGIGGARVAVQFAGIALLFVGAERACEVWGNRGQEGWWCSLTAGFLTSMVFSAATGLRRSYARWAVVAGCAGGLAIGTVLDLYAAFIGESAKYPGVMRNNVQILPHWLSLPAPLLEKDEKS